MITVDNTDYLQGSLTMNPKRLDRILQMSWMGGVSACAILAPMATQILAPLIFTLLECTRMMDQWCQRSFNAGTVCANVCQRFLLTGLTYFGEEEIMLCHWTSPAFSLQHVRHSAFSIPMRSHAHLFGIPVFTSIPVTFFNDRRIEAARILEASQCLN